MKEGKEGRWLVICEFETLRRVRKELSNIYPLIPVNSGSMVTLTEPHWINTVSWIFLLFLSFSDPDSLKCYNYRLAIQEKSARHWCTSLLGFQSLKSKQGIDERKVDLDVLESGHVLWILFPFFLPLTPPPPKKNQKTGAGGCLVWLFGMIICCRLALVVYTYSDPCWVLI